MLTPEEMKYKAQLVEELVRITGNYDIIANISEELIKDAVESNTSISRMAMIIQQN